ncbi:cellulase family glycosylhydrolase [Catellatospora tritici]|uniref:cellulase family glycosylhydrolase n=1 Tax=Catellatospora tritici TaxID=2851566 RepID=UPI001C2D2827|nr:cellulase family glycosylhydrolase [Catellatospora tritici]MBV1853570.1 glycoside hydrolase family 5 protein [Catellatospora tritici]
MTPLASAPPTPRRSFLHRPEFRAGVAAMTVVLAVVAAGAALDPSGLLATVGGRGLPLVGTGGVYQWAPLLVGLPILLAGTGVPVAVLAGRAGATARWVFAAAWAAVVGAAATAAAATGLAAAFPLLGSHLSAESALRFALATSGFAAMKFLLVGPLVAGAAALAFRIGPRRAADPDSDQPAGATGGAMTVVLAVVGIVAAEFGARWWRGGPVGYAFTGPLIAPTVAAGVLGFLAGTALFLGALWVTLRALHRRLAASAPVAVAASVWLAAVAAGLVLGVVDALVAALLTDAPPQAGPDDWWISTTLLSVATGLGFGVTVGLLGAPFAGLVWRLRHRWTEPSRTPRAWQVATLAMLLIAIVLITGTTPAPGPASAERATPAGGLERLRLLPGRDGTGLPVIGDVTGRQVVLRGVNVNQLIDYYLRDPGKPATQPLTDDDFAQMAAMGFSVVRLGMSWSRLEPQRGVFDEAYLRQITAAVASAKAHGMYTVLDMHSDAWGNALAKPSQRCDGGTSPTTGWDGAPAWATITDGTLHCQFMARDLAPAAATAYANFYTDRDGIQSELVRTWAWVARAFANEPAVAGFDLFNEPGIGALPPTTSGLLLGRYYDAAITAIRQAERAGGGYPHLVFFEPSVLWSGLAFDVTPPPGFTDDRELVFAPHPYSESITMDQSLGLTIASIERNLTVSARAAESYGAALWTGEWGWFGDPAVDGAKVRRFAAAQDRLGIGGAFWVWRQGCGSPETGDDAVTSGNLVRVDCATGASIAPPAGFAQPLSRAYPKIFPGHVDGWESSGDGRGLALVAVADPDADCHLEVWVPGDAAPTIFVDGVEEPATVRVPGGWRLTGCAQGRYSVTVTP